MYTLKKFRLLLLVVLAQAGIAMAADSMPGADDIAAKLAAPPPSSGAQTRSFFNQDSSRGITVTNAKPDEPPAIDLNINFEFNSARLTPEGSVLVGNLGRALKDPRLAGKRFRIEGHTDGKGSDAYNQALSERRADAVRRELVALHNVDAARIEALGFGKSRLLDALNPEAAANRRVRVINLGGAQ
jgi:outer membrane protein OmpA-like peptidoglycan-associated protein